MKYLVLFTAFAVLTACGNSSNKGKSAPAIEVETCGDAALTSDETCDPAIESGTGACPTTCENITACSVGTLVGSADACTASCSVTVIEMCIDDDGCCPAACDDTTDSDCSMTCGDNVVDEGETCDGNCPTECAVADACQVGIATGSAENCSLECAYETTITCIDGDGCCPAACNEDNDSDCSDSCGDGVVVAGEVCDGNCPTSCDDGDACTIDGSSGAASLCNLVCTHQAVTACQNGDGCCAAGCTFDNDSDCACVPDTCANLGATCGTVSDGCGGTLNCGGCNATQACENNACVTIPIGQIGDACAASANCAGQAFCADNGDFKDGFCTEECMNDFDCQSGTHCIALPNYSNKICAPNCQADNDCRQDGYGCYDVEGDGTTECAPMPQGSSPVGGACAGLYECSTASTFCVSPGTAFPGGFCSRGCMFNIECPSNTVCWTDNNLCVPTCTTASDCRPQYACQQATNEITGETIGLCIAP